MSDQFYDCVVTAWHLRHPNARGKYRGFAKVIHPPEGVFGVFIKSENICTLGEDSVNVGSRIRCRIVPPERDEKTPVAEDVEIYLPE